MNQAELIRSLRLEQGLTQRKLAEVLHVTDKAVSKWERGLGQPDASLLGPLAKALHVELEALLEGTLSKNARSSGNLNRLKVFVCPCCGNVVTAETPARVSCCGRGLKALVPREAAEGGTALPDPHGRRAVSVHGASHDPGTSYCLRHAP